MKANALAKNYVCLTPQERFQLILAASGRGDEAERDRLVRTGGRITLSMPDHSPYAHAFDELARLTFIELLEDAARYFEAFAHVDEACDGSGDEEEPTEEDDLEAAGDEEEQETGEEADSERAEDEAERWPAWYRFLDLALAAGYVLRAKAHGWKLFCERLNVPPFLLWEGLPGFDRLERARALAEKVAFVPEGFLRWLNAVRPAGEPELTEVPLTAEAVAAATEEAFRQRVGWWGG